MAEVDLEVQNWFKSKTQGVDPDTDRMTWWEDNGATFPRLRKLARIILPVPISAAPSERNWSSAEYVSSGRRSSTSADTMEATLLVSSNVQTRAKLSDQGLFDCMKPRKIAK